MPVRNLHWYNANEGRAYPVDDGASCVSDTGVRLPSDIISDMNLRWPSTLGNHAFITAVSNTNALVTVTLQAAISPTDTTSFTPLAVLTVRKPVQIGRMYPVNPQVPGVGGWIVFGNGVTGEPYSGRFSSPQQSLVTPRAGRAYRPMPVSSVQVEHANQKLTGMVLLKASDPLTITKEERFIEGVNHDCIVVRLVDGAGIDGFPVPADANAISGFKPKSVFETFAGPCAGRPESNTCGCPNPIQFVNAVAPDCGGTITIEFQGCAQVASIGGGDGIALSCEFGLTDACLPEQLPSSEGLLPSEYTPANVPAPPFVPPPPPPLGVSDSLVTDGGLPYAACVVGGMSPLTTELGVWIVSGLGTVSGVCPLDEYRFPVSESLSLSHSISVSSSYVYLSDGSFMTDTAAIRNIAIFDVDVSTVYRKVTTETMLTQGPSGAKQNAQLILNYQPHPSVAGQFIYFAVEVDYESQEFRLVRFNGTTFQTISPSVITAPGIQLDKWYRITTTVLPSGPYGDVEIVSHFESITDPGVTDVLMTVTLNNYQPSNGKFGLGTNRAISRFAYLKIEEAP